MIKKLRIALVALTLSPWALSCPTCVGRITEQSPPFFSNDFYQPEAENTQESSHPTNISQAEE